jgi:hypothetical protein
MAIGTITMKMLQEWADDIKSLASREYAEYGNEAIAEFVEAMRVSEGLSRQQVEKLAELCGL